MASAIEQWAQSNGVTPQAPAKTGTTNNSAVSAWAKEAAAPPPVGKNNLPLNTGSPFNPNTPNSQFVQPDRGPTIFSVGAGLKPTGTENGTVQNAKATVIREQLLGSQPIPKTPLNINGSDVASAAQAIPRTVASLAMGNSGKTVEPSTLDPISRFLLGDQSIKSLPMQAAETETALNAAGVKGKTATTLAVTGVAANAVLNLLPFLAPFEEGAQGLADKLATNSKEIVLSPEQLQEIASRDMSGLVGQKKVFAEKVQEMAKFYADKGQSLTIDARTPAETVSGKVATAIGGENKAPFLAISEGGKPIEGAAPFAHETPTTPLLTAFSHEAPAEAPEAVNPFVHEDLIQTPAEQSAFAHEQAPIPTGTILHAEIVPGLSKTIEQDILPKAKGAAAIVSDIYHEIADAVNPTGAAPKDALDVIMKAKGDFEKQLFRTEQTMKSITKAWDKQPEENRLSFMDKVEAGQPVDPKDKDLADMYRKRLNNAYQAISKYKDINQLENFFPHFWEKPNDVLKNFMPVSAATRPLEGNKSFLHHRLFATIQEGINAGFKPVTTNPEELMQIYEANVGKFLMVQKIKAGLKENNQWVNIPSNGKLPPGYTYIEDNIARSYYPPVEIKSATGTTKNYALAGRAAAPTPIARLINNHLSTDWVSKSPIGKTLMQAKNSINALQLGFSAFHITAETLNAIMTGIDVGLSKIARGQIVSGTKAIATAPFNIVNYWRDGLKFYQGNPELMAIENDLFHGGATLKKNQYFKNTVLDNFGKNVREGNMVGALGRAPFAALEAGTRLVFSQIPKVKIGAFRQLFSEELERKAGQVASGKITRATIARETWNNIENRFGQINYDNLFWNKTFKAVNMLTWRAVGWNLGTIRELGGGATQDLAKFANDTIHGRKPDFTPKMRYTLAIIGVVATLSAIYEYLHTGHGPKTLEEYFYPENGAVDQNGDPVKVQFPTYMKDIYGYMHHPLQTAGNKLSPELAMIMQLMQNRDYYGNYVYNQKDSLPTELNQTLKYIAGEMAPFSITNLTQLNKGKASLEEKAEGFMGINKAPAAISESDKTQAIYDSLSTQGPKTPEEQQLADTKSQFRKQIQNGKIPTFQELKNAGVVTDAKGYRAFLKAAQQTPVQRAYKTLKKSVKATIQKP